MTDCPTPHKIRYPSKPEARRIARAASENGRSLEPYRCEAGHWHLTSQSKATMRRLRRRLRRTP